MFNTYVQIEKRISNIININEGLYRLENAMSSNMNEPRVYNRGKRGTQQRLK